MPGLAWFGLALAVLTLPGCGMNRAVGVLPNTLDGLAATSQGTGGDQPEGRVKP